MNNPRVVFAGTPEFALASLRALVEAGITPVAVYTQPDRRAGRGKKLTASPVKQYALAEGIEVRQPATLRDADVVAELAAFNADVMIVAAYGLILPQDVLDTPRFGCLNVHASLLPRWRGAAPVQAAILAGDDETGISLMRMEAGLDTGPVYAASSLAIGAEETAGELHDRLAMLGGALLVDNLDAILKGRLEAQAQDDQASTYAPKVQKQDAELDWRGSATDLARCVRAYNPVPGSWFEIDGQRIKCWSATSSAGVDAPPGTVVSNGRDGVVIACGTGALRMMVLQRPGKRRVSAQEFAAQLDLAGRCLH